jgi:hypothetical protein
MASSTSSGFCVEQAVATIAASIKNGIVFFMLLLLYEISTFPGTTQFIKRGNREF